jgi:aryl-alcohol dehydrogenase-like predicted oxidoreductase
MKYKPLGTSSLAVTPICLGTMMMGSQTDTKLSKQIISAADHAGINFIDTAEMYSIPPDPATHGNSERIVGEWLKERGERDKVIVATKITGRSDMLWIRGKESTQQLCLDQTNIRHAIENSLRRLQSDYIDLYQIHWPDRPLSKFGMKMQEAALDDKRFIPIEETLRELAKLVAEGKVRYLGVSNENLNGVREFVRLAKEHNLPMIASIQNAYGLINREFEGELADFCQKNRVSLLPYSLLAMGHLTGKYLHGQLPHGSRKQLFDNLGRYDVLNDGKIVSAYLAIAVEEGISLNALAHAFVYRQTFVDSTIIGATSLAQLQQNLDAYKIRLSDTALKKIDAVHAKWTNPCP